MSVIQNIRMNDANLQQVAVPFFSLDFANSKPNAHDNVSEVRVLS